MRERFLDSRPNSPRRRLGGAIISALLAVARAQAQDPTADDTALPPIAVTASKLPVPQTLTQRSYAAAADMQGSFGSAADLLSSIPSIDVDSDGVVSLRGDTNVVILVDGKPSALFSGAAAGDNLQSMPAKDIERIEVMTDPPPQYRAEGVAGVINIITRKHAARGYSGSVQSSVGNQGRYAVGASGAYTGEALRVEVSATYREDVRRRLLNSSSTASDGVSRSNLDEMIHRLTPPVTVSVGYDFNDRQSISADFTRTGRSGPRDYTELDSASNAAGVLTQLSERQSRGHDAESDYDGKLGFTQKLGERGGAVELSAHRGTSNNSERYDYDNEPLIPPDAPYSSFLAFSERNRISQIDVDYRGPHSETSAFKAGYAFEQDGYGYDSNGGDTDATGALLLADPNLLDDFRYLQSIHALYASEEMTAGAWHWLVGAREELTLTHGRQPALGADDRSRYAKLFPNAVLDYHVDRKSTLSFAASRRITRPDADALNPFVDREYTPNLRAGNAFLKPQLTTSLQTGYDYQWRKRTYSLTLYYRRNTDSITDVTTDLGGGFFLATKANLPLSTFEGAEFSAGGRLGRLGYNLSGNLFRNEIDATDLGLPGLRANTGLNGKLKLDYRITSADSAEMVVSRSDRRLTPQGYVSPIDTVNVGYKRRIGGSLSVLVTGTDVFNGQRYERIAITPAYTEQYERIVRGRVVWVGFVYSFGSADAKSPSLEYDSEQ